MERPNDIPEDVWEVAERSLHPAFRLRVYKSPVANLQLEGIARAILAERERCAKVAEEMAETYRKGFFRGDWAMAANQIAAAIRKGV